MITVSTQEKKIKRCRGEAQRVLNQNFKQQNPKPNLFNPNPNPNPNPKPDLDPGPITSPSPRRILRQNWKKLTNKITKAAVLKMKAFQQSNCKRNSAVILIPTIFMESTRGMKLLRKLSWKTNYLQRIRECQRGKEGEMRSSKQKKKTIKQENQLLNFLQPSGRLRFRKTCRKKCNFKMLKMLSTRNRHQSLKQNETRSERLES